jgi:dolichyl-phosphate-mannose-protein mannosyltransferase
MFQALRDFKIGRPQLLAGAMLLAFLAQGLWVASSRKLSDLEYQYISSGFPQKPGQEYRVTSPMTGVVAAFPVRVVNVLKGAAPGTLGSALAIPRPWLLRLPFLIFGVWLGGALWWVARRLFDDVGGYMALALYCSSPAVIMISSNIGPEIILAWSTFGLIYTAIGVAHTLYAPVRKWIPRTIILGLSIGFAVATAAWSFTLVLLVLVFMMYLAPGRRQAAVGVLACASALGLAVTAIVIWLVGSHGLLSSHLITPHPGADWPVKLGHALAFAFVDGYSNVNSYLFVLLFIAALTAYCSWRRARYFGNTFPLVTAFSVVVVFSVVPALHLWEAALGLSFVFLFIGGVASDVVESVPGIWLSSILTAGFGVRAVLGLMALGRWIQMNAR